MNILGISALYHDSAACLLQDGKLVAAAQEERFTRKKHDPAFPKLATHYCLQKGGIRLEDLDHVVFYDKPLITFERLLLTYLSIAPRGLKSWLEAMPSWLGEKLHMPRIFKKELGWTGEILYTEHHQSHAASAFYPSPFEDAAVLTIDGVGEWATATLGMGRGNDLQIIKEMHFPDSIGLLYSAFTYFTGFKVNSGEYKLMGLAPYGEPIYKDRILDKVVDLKEDGSIRLDMDYFDFLGGLRMTSPSSTVRPVRASPRSPNGRWTSPPASRPSPRTPSCAWPPLPTRRPVPAICAWPVAWRSTVWPTARSCARDLSRICGSSPRPVMPVALSVPPTASGTSIWV